MTVKFKYQIKQPVFFLENSSIQKGYVVRQHFNNEINDFKLDATADNLKVEKSYQVKLHHLPYKSQRFNEDSLFFSREEFFDRMTESWNSL